MKNLLFACIIVLVFTGNSFAKLMIVSLDEAIKNSDLIVIGMLKDISEKTENFAIHGKGIIVVDEFIAGKVISENGFAIKSADKLTLKYVENFACVMGSHKRIENEKGIFLLTLNDEKEIQYKDFRSLESLSEIKKLLKKGVNPNQISKTLKILNNIEQNTQSYLPEESSEETVKCLYSTENKSREYSPLSAILVILASIALYYSLYRSRFKIR